MCSQFSRRRASIATGHGAAAHGNRPYPTHVSLPRKGFQAYRRGRARRDNLIDLATSEAIQAPLVATRRPIGHNHKLDHPLGVRVY